MSFLDTVERAKAYLERQGRVSLRALKREFDLDDAALEELVEELVDVQSVAVSDGKVLQQSGEVTTRPSAIAEKPSPERAPNEYTPKHLADKILKGKSALEGERKQVTVLFADVKGSMELAEQLDPEDWHRILDGFLQVLADGVHRFEGTVNQYTGDGIMALFGAPIAHEDHAQRACYAALHLREELRRYSEELKRTRGLGFAARIGLNSGEVVVGKIGDDLRMDYTAQGHTVGLAARMEQLAEPGAVYMSRHTAGLVSGFFELRDLGNFEVKGLSKPLGVFELEGAGQLHTRLEVSRARGFTRFVGRTREMQVLNTALDQATDGHGIGEAGVGKSRICAEFVESCRAKGIAVYDAHCLSHGKTLSFLPVLELLRNLFDISERDDERDARRKIAGELTLLDDKLRDALPLVLDFLGVADPERPTPQMDPEARQRRLQGFVRAFVQARPDPTVLLIDDLHWIDSGSDTFVAQIVEAVQETRTMLLVNFRPEYRADWTTRSHYQQLPLVPLDPKAIAELLTDLLGSDPSVAALNDVIQERSGGSPFFTEEVVQSMVEAGSLQGVRGAYRFVGKLEDLVVPATVQAVLAARIDRLPEEAKHVLQAASVVGKTFSDTELQSVVSLPESDVANAVRHLIGAELIYEHALYPEREYSFKHPLTQEVAYQTQLSDRRADTHRAVARTLSELPADKRGERAALVAHHWEEAGETEESARWYRRAAQWATGRAPAEAAQHWQKLRALVAELPESERTRRWGAIACSQLLNLAWRQAVLSSDEIATLFQEGSDFAERNGDTGLLALIKFAYATALGTRGRIHDWSRYSEEALQLAEQTGSEVFQAAIITALAPATEFGGDCLRAIELAERGIALTGKDPSQGEDLLFFSPYLLLMALLGGSLVTVGRMTEGVAQLRHSLQLARDRDDAASKASASSLFVLLAYLSGDHTGAVAHGRASVQAAERVGSLQQLNSFTWLGLASVLDKDWSQAVSVLEHCRTLTRETGSRLTESWWLTHLALAYAGCGDAAARATAEQAVAAAREQGAVRYEIDAQLSLARVLLTSGNANDSQTIDAALTRALECVNESGARAYLPMVIEERARLAQLTGDEAAAARELHEAHRLYEEIGATGHVKRLAKELGP